jgi:hypothetical protein
MRQLLKNLAATARQRFWQLPDNYGNRFYRTAKTVAALRARLSTPRLPSLALAFGCARSAAHHHQVEPRCAQTSNAVTFPGRSAAKISGPVMQAKTRRKPHA